MPVDWELLERVNNRSIREQRDYRCAFAEDVLAAPEPGDHAFVEVARAILAEEWRPAGLQYNGYVEYGAARPRVNGGPLGAYYRTGTLASGEIPWK